MLVKFNIHGCNLCPQVLVFHEMIRKPCVPGEMNAKCGQVSWNLRWRRPLMENRSYLKRSYAPSLWVYRIFFRTARTLCIAWTLPFFYATFIGDCPHACRIFIYCCTRQVVQLSEQIGDTDTHFASFLHSPSPRYLQILLQHKTSTSLSGLSGLLWVHLLAILVVSDSWWWCSVASAFSRSYSE